MNNNQLSTSELIKLFRSVFNLKGDRVLFLTDSENSLSDTSPHAISPRGTMLLRWYEAMKQLVPTGEVIQEPEILTYSPTGMHGAPLPRMGLHRGSPVEMTSPAAKATLVIAITEYSATSTLRGVWCRDFPGMRAASLPGVDPAMEATALRADYTRVAQACEYLRPRLDKAESASILFSNGDHLYLDLRWRTAHSDDGLLPPDAPKDRRVINLPSGETFIVPYEGENKEFPSLTEGVFPITWKHEGKEGIVRLEVRENKVTRVLTSDSISQAFEVYLQSDSGYRNVAELGLGTNPRAKVTGNVLEDEKVGPHIALGLSHYLGGCWDPSKFDNPDKLWHQDFVFVPERPVHVKLLTLNYGSNDNEVIVKDGEYVEPLKSMR